MVEVEVHEKIIFQQNPAHINANAAAATANLAWLYVGSEDGIVRKFSFADLFRDLDDVAIDERHAVPMTVASAASFAPADSSGVRYSETLHSASFSPPSCAYSLAMEREGVWGLLGDARGRTCLFLTGRVGGATQNGVEAHVFASESTPNVAQQPIAAIEVASDQQSFFAGGWDGRICLWNLNDGSLMREFNSQNTNTKTLSSQVSALKSNPTNPSMLLSTSIAGAAAVWDVRCDSDYTACLLHNAPFYRAKSSWCYDAEWASDGNVFFCSKRFEEIEMWDVRRNDTPCKIIQMPIDSGPVTALRRLHNFPLILCASYDSIRAYHIFEDKFTVLGGGSHHTSSGALSRLLLSENDKYLACISGNRGWNGRSNGTNCLLQIKIS